MTRKGATKFEPLTRMAAWVRGPLARVGVAVIVSVCATVAFGVPAAAGDVPPQIHTVAGSGTCVNPQQQGAPPIQGVSPCGNVLATSDPINVARSVAALPDGSFLYVDYADDVIQEVNPQGVVFTVAGNGTTTDAPDGTLAIASGLNGPVSVAPLPNGGFLITEYSGSVVRMVSPGGPGSATITTIAGTGSPQHNTTLSGTGGSVPLDYPSDAEPTSSGGVLIADTYDGYIRYLSSPSADASESTIAGAGSCSDAGGSCNGMPASDIELSQPVSVSPLQNGSGGYLVAEYGASTIDEISQTSSAGTFSVVAGTPGQAGFGGDGGPATSAQLDAPEGVASLSTGGFVIADTSNNRIRMVSPSGTITTFAGNGVASSGGDAGPATSASLNGPASVSPMANGDFLVADTNNGTIRIVTIPPVTTISLPSRGLGRDGWYVDPVTPTVTATNAGWISCELDPTVAPPAYGAIPIGCPYTSGSPIETNGTHVLWAAGASSYIQGQTLDNASAYGYLDGGQPVSVTVKVDLSTPTITCLGTPSFKLGQRRATVRAKVTDRVSGAARPFVTAPADTAHAGMQVAYVIGANNAGTEFASGCSYTVRGKTLAPTPRLKAAFSSPSGSSSTTVKQLTVANVPAGASVNVACNGNGCPFQDARGVTGRKCGRRPCKARSPERRRTVDLVPLFRGSRLAARVQLDITVTGPNDIGRSWRFTTVGGRAPRSATGCLEPGSTTVTGSCRP